MTEEQTGTDQDTTRQTEQTDGAPDPQAAQLRDAAAEHDPAADATEQADTPAPKKKRAKSTAKKTRTVELTLTVTGTADGEWQADLMHSGKRVVQGLQVPASSVSKAAAELHTDISETIEEVLSTARQQQEAKLAELEAEVERVRKTLAELES